MKAFLRRFRLRKRTASLQITPPSLQSKQQQTKKHRLSLLFVVGFFAALLLDLLSLPSSAATTTLSFNNAPTLVSGTALTAGAVYRFPSVATGTDALVQITTIQNAQLKVLDDNTALPARFQPTIAPSAASLTNAQSYVRFDFKLTPSSTPAGTSFAAAPTTTATNVYFSAQDVDGNGAANTIREFVETIGGTTSYIANPTLLQPMGTLPIAGGIGFEQINSSNVQAGIGTDDRYEFYSYLGTSVSTFSIVGGNITGGTGCVLNNAGCDRQNSWTFDVADVQKLDFGDAPASYGDAYHPVLPAPTVYLGTSVDGDDAPSRTVNADGDDTTGTDDETGVASFPTLLTTSTSYSLNLTCAGGGTVAGWIDFNRNGVFDASERASGTCSGTTVTLNWAGLSGLSAGTTYARFRTASIAAEVANPTGQASNGEVEDYPLTIAPPPPVTLSGTVFSDADASVTINGSDAGTNAGSSSLTIYAVDGTGKVVDKSNVGATGTYSLTNVPQNTSVTLRILDNASVAIGATAPSTPTIPSGWFHTGENLNGTIDAAIATLGNIALTTTTANVTNQNFGIRQAYTIAADAAPNTCNPDYRTALNTGVSAGGGQLAVGANDLNWTAEWIAGPASGPGTPYAPPRPVGVMPAVVTGNLAPGAWVNEPANARWISYPFRLPGNGNGVHNDADLDGISGEGNSGFSGPGTSDDVRLKFTSQLTLPSNANTLAISLPVGVAIDNQFVSIKVNGVENLVPTPAANPIAADYGTTQTVNITSGWQAGVNTIEIIADSGPDRVGFFLGIQAATTQVCSGPTVLLVKRLSAINGTSITTTVDDPGSPNDNAANWPAPVDATSGISAYLKGVINGGTIKPGDLLEYTIYFLSNGGAAAANINLCDLVPSNSTFVPDSFSSVPESGINLTIGATSTNLTNVPDTDSGQFFNPGGTPSVSCSATNTNGAVVVNVVKSPANLPNATAPGTPTNSYGFIRFRARVN